MVLIFLLLTGFVTWQLLLATYYVWFFPLSTIPGPKIAAATILYEFYYEVIRSGNYTRHIEKLHRRYGPIVRISPYEVHINDPEFCVGTFATARKTDKYGWWYRVFGGPGATISTECHKLHRARRTAFQDYLSARHVDNYLPSILEKLAQVSLILNDTVETGGTANLSSIYRCMAADVVSSFILPRSLNLLQSEDLGDSFRSSLRFFFEMATISRYICFLEPLISILPSTVLGLFLTPPARSLLDLVNQIEIGVLEIVSNTKNCTSKPTHLMESISRSLNYDQEKYPTRLIQEAEQFIVAGSETTGHTLAVITFHIIENPHIRFNLVHELRAANLSFEDNIDIKKIQNLPYLSAVITEGLRLSNGVGSRLPRVNKLADVFYRQWRIPAGTPLSMTSRLHHENPVLFPEPQKFYPERWLKTNSKVLKKYLSPFGHGPRRCVGMHLAMAEIQVTIAYIFLHYQICNSGTTEDDLVSAHDLGAPFPKRSSPGLRVSVLPLA